MKQDLAGQWNLRLDAENCGITEQWFNQSFSETIDLPGSLQTQGFGNEVTLETEWVGNIVDRSLFEDPRYEPYRQPGNIKYPCWLTPDKRYIGAAWYQREINIPENWAGKRITVTLERVHWESRVWLDGNEIGRNQSLSTPHVYDLGKGVTPGKHRLTIRVDNRMIVNVGQNAHSMSDHTQGNWNGIIGHLELGAESLVWLRNVQVFPDVKRKVARIQIDVDSLLKSPVHGTVTASVEATNGVIAQSIAPVSKNVTFAALGGLADLDLSTEGGHIDLEVPLGDEAQLWDEFTPVLYKLTVDLACTVAGQSVADCRTLSFGLREIGVDGTQIVVNGRKTFIRGTLECCIFPLTGYPPCDVNSWKRIINVCKAHGLNLIRFHSWCPPEAAFVAADELGFYYQVECSTWPNQGAAIGEGRPLDRWLYEEADRIVTQYGNHPSFVMMAHGNEPAGRHQAFLSVWVTYWRKRDSRRIYTSGAGWPAIPENQYHNISEPRIQRWGEGLNSRINALPPETRTNYRSYVESGIESPFHRENENATPAPIISHEIGQWCVYPNFAEMSKYTGLLKPKNFEIFQDFLEASGMGDQARDFLIASGKLQALCYKEDIESALRTPGFGGFHLLDLHDFPGQGTALVGVLDPFWDEKGYITAAEFRRFCNATVPLALMDKRFWRSDETFVADIQIAHFGPKALEHAVIRWQLLDETGTVVDENRLPPQTIQIGNQELHGRVLIPLHDLPTARRYKLVVSLADTPFANDWDLWLFAQRVPSEVPNEVLITQQLDECAFNRLALGGKVLLLLTSGRVKTTCQIGFSTVFWNTAWTSNQPPHTLGILCDSQHPIFAHFPTEAHSNWQWWELIHGSAAMQLDALPQQLRPLVQPIDTWFEARRLALLFEAQVAGGKLMVCSMDLQHDLEKRLVARQMRYSLLAYMSSERFNPTLALTDEQVRTLFD
ncbi:MAG: glycoside hydrolase [Caldilineaceae bacterium]